MNKKEKNELANLFYRMHGYQVEMDYDFSKARHPQERLMFNLAEIAWQFISTRTKTKDKKNKIINEDF